MLSASPQSSVTPPCPRFDEALDHIYDKILEDEDKILIAEQRKLKRRCRNSSVSYSSQDDDGCEDGHLDDYHSDSDDSPDVSLDSDDVEHFDQ